MLLLEAGALVFVRVSGEAWVGLGGVGFAVGALLVMFIVNIVSVSSSFSMALSMGCTRRAYFLSGECAMVLWTLAAALLALPAALADEALRPVLAPADARPLLEVNPMLGLYRDHFWTVALGRAVGGGARAVLRGHHLEMGRDGLLDHLGRQHAAGRAGELCCRRARRVAVRGRTDPRFALRRVFRRAVGGAVDGGHRSSVFGRVAFVLRRASLK